MLLTCKLTESCFVEIQFFEKLILVCRTSFCSASAQSLAVSNTVSVVLCQLVLIAFARSWIVCSWRWRRPFFPRSRKRSAIVTHPDPWSQQRTTQRGCSSSPGAKKTSTWFTGKSFPMEKHGSVKDTHCKIRISTWVTLTHGIYYILSAFPLAPPWTYYVSPCSDYFVMGVLSVSSSRQRRCRSVRSRWALLSCSRRAIQRAISRSSCYRSKLGYARRSLRRSPGT